MARKKKYIVIIRKGLYDSKIIFLRMTKENLRTSVSKIKVMNGKVFESKAEQIVMVELESCDVKEGRETLFRISFHHKHM